MTEKLDQVEREYEIAIRKAYYSGSDDEAFELSIGLQQYQEMFKTHQDEAE